MGLKQTALSGVKWTAAASVILNIFQIVQLSVLARFLNREEFGIFAIVMVVILFTNMFLDLGLSPAIIHEQNIGKEELNSLYWFNIWMGVALYAILYIGSDYIGEFYENPEIAFYIRIVGVTIVLQAFGQQFYTLFEKDMKFDIVTRYQVFVSIFRMVLSLVLAFANFKLYALIIPNVLGALLNSLLLFYAGTKYFYTPKLGFDVRHIVRYLSFGGYYTAGQVINYINAKADEFLIGKLLTSSDLGLYSVAKKLVEKPASVINPIITRVTLPALALVQNDEDKIKDVYLKTINYLSSVNFPVYIMIIVFSDDIIILLLGGQWSDSVNIVKLLSVYFMVRSTGNPVGSLLLAKGKPHYSLNWNSLMLFLIPPAIYVGSKWGIKGVVYAWLALSGGLLLPNWFFLVRPLCEAGFYEYFKQIAIPGIISLSMFVASLAAKEILGQGILYYLAVLVGFALIFVGLNFLINREFLATMLELVGVKKYVRLRGA